MDNYFLVPNVLTFLSDPIITTFAYDNSTGILYTASENEISVFRILENGIRYRFLDFIKVKFISVLSNRAIIVIATQYSVVMYRLTSSFEKLYFLYEKFLLLIFMYKNFIEYIIVLAVNVVKLLE